MKLTARYKQVYDKKKYLNHYIMALVFIYYIKIVEKRVHLYIAYYILPNAELMNTHNTMFYGDRLCNTMWHAV